MRRSVHVAQIVQNVFRQIDCRIGMSMEEADVDQAAAKGNDEILTQRATFVARKP